MSMTSKERLERALAGRETDRLPFSPFLVYVWDYFPEEVRSAGQLAFHQRVGADPLWRGAPCPVKVVVPGAEFRTFNQDGRAVTEIWTPVGVLREAHARNEIAGPTLFLVEHPLKAEEDYKIQMWLEEHTRFERDPLPVAEHLAGVGREGLSLGLLLPRGKSAYQTLVEHLCGTEELAYAQADFPDTVETLWNLMAAKDLEAVRLALDSPYEYFITWEDSRTQNYSPQVYDRFIGSAIASWCRVLASAGKHYIQHACGHTRDLLPRMKRDGVCAVESLSPPPTGNVTIGEARQMVGSGLGIIGGVEPTHFLNLSLEDLSRYVEQTIAEAAGGPFVLANSDSCPPGVTVEKFKRVADIARATCGTRGLP
jgi:hypothetical protein